MLRFCCNPAVAKSGVIQQVFHMDRAISAREANQRFCELLREVSEGHSFTIMSRDRAVARVIPVDRLPEQRSIRRLLEFLGSLPIRHSGDWARGDLYG